MAHDGTAIISLVPRGSEHQVVGERKVLLPGISLEILGTRLIELASWKLRDLNDPFWRLYIPMEGEASISSGKEMDKVDTRLCPGQAYLITPHTTINSENSSTFTKWYVHFTLGQRGDRANAGVYPVEFTPSMREAIRHLSDSEKGAYPWASFKLVGDALDQLSPDVWSQRKVDPRVEAAMDFMHKHLGRKILADEVAVAAGVSVRNLNHLFRRHLGVSPMNVLLDFRINQACRMLRHSDASIDEIAEGCGFPNRYYLSRMMKQARSTSPAAYRRAE